MPEPTNGAVPTIEGRADAVIAADPDQRLEQIATFLRSIGIRISFGSIFGPTVLPGIRIQRGTIVVDRLRRLAPGDLLHEAGHLAVLTEPGRQKVDGSLEATPADEMMAIAWSYAAAIHLGLPPTLVFHDKGYRGGSSALIENFSAGRFVGVPMLDWIGLTVDPHRWAAGPGSPYPTMIKWLRGP